MKIALIGKGKTGGKVLELYPNDDITIFDSSNPVNLEQLRKCDVAIAFIPGEIFNKIIPILVESKIPVVTGATGAGPPNDLNQTLIDLKLTWIMGSNFSLGMRIVHQMIKKLQHTSALFDDYNFKIHEVHHTKKLDGPSGTALSWEQWLNEKADISFSREGDVVGDHQLTLNTLFENISIRHEALDRKIFAQGAIWAANYLFKQKNKDYGLKLFEDITEELMTNNKE